MADGNPFFIDQAHTPLVSMDGIVVRYVGSSGHGSACFHNDAAPALAHAVGDQLTGGPVDVSSLMARIGMTPAGFTMPDEAFAAAGYGVVGAIPTEVVMAQHPQIGSNSKPPGPVKAPWTEEEDSILKDMVVHHGERKWSLIAQCLPGRIGKQCRERWINHLRPDIKQNDVWTEDDDEMLINAHKYYGNRWSAIAKHLPGRSENAVKNHWNATLRSLKAKRRLKKKKSEQVPPGQFSILEEYIRSLYLLEDAVPSAPLSSSVPFHNLAYNGSIDPVVHVPAAATDATNSEMSLTATNSARSSNLGTINLNMPPQLPDLNTISDPEEYNLRYPMYVPEAAPRQQLATNQDPRQSCSSLNFFPYADYFTLLRTELGRYHVGASSSNAVGNDYHSEAGPSNAGGSGVPVGDTDNIFELPSREFLSPSKDEATLDLTRFK